MDIERILDDLLLREGGYVNHPADLGGPTNYGITLKTLQEWRQRPVTIEQLKALPKSEAREIYKVKYLTEPGLHKIRDPYVMVLAFDCSVNHGQHRVIRWLQQVVGVVDDGQFGPVTEIAVNTIDPVRLYQRLLAKRVRFYGRVLSSDPELRKARAAGFDLQAEFAAGWCNRAAEFVELSV